MDVGVEFSHYRVVEHIGRGGMADVWSARDKRLQRTVAIKTIGRDLSQDLEPLKLFEREAQMIARLEHPHILPIYDFGELDGQLYIVMRYVSGGSLEDRVASGALPIPEALRQARAIASALDYAHSNNVVHLDLKPSNILMDSNQSPYLADFGLATMLGPEGRAANPGYGTLLYMAPEQLTASVIDHRADIYSFAILLFQMLTGEMPFDATTSLALKQLQWQEDLPELSKLGDEMAETLTPILRRGTALNPDERPNTVAELVVELETALAGTSEGALAVATIGRGGELAGGETLNLGLMQTEAGPDAMARREAQDIYNRARRAWAHGQGRFLLGITHFMLVNDFYRRADEHGLPLDEAGQQMLLRGALEYDVDVDFWWNRLDVDNRRWVALHAIRSDSPPARVRALYRLETIPDSDPPRIPALVAGSLQLEVNEPAKLAAIHVLGTRAQRQPAATSGVYPPAPASAGLTGRLLTTRTRLSVQSHPASAWREAVYSPEIDALLAHNALDGSQPAVAELAARTIGRIRSLAALKVVAQAQRSGTPGALRALALVRDEAPSLPSVVSPQGQLYAWLANTWRRLTDDPLDNVGRFVFAMIGGTLAMGAHVFITFRSEAIFHAERWGRTISIGLTFGLFIAVLTLLASQVPARLRGFWPWWARLAFSGVVGWLWGTLTWGAFTWFFFNYPPNWDVMAFAGAGTALGLVLAAVFNWPGWLAAAVAALTTYLPIHIMFQYFWNGTPGLQFGPLNLELPSALFSEAVRNSPPAVLYYDFPEQIITLAVPVVILVALGIYAQALWRGLRRRLAEMRAARAGAA